MQITDLAVEEKIYPLWRLGFRPFFLIGAIFSSIAITLWLLIYLGNVTFTPYGGGYWWHIHEMLFGFVIAIVAGFLLTAVQNWTGIRGASGNTLKLLTLFWALPRILLLLPEMMPHSLIIIADLIFLPAVAWVLAKPIVKIKQYRNLFFVPLLLSFTLLNMLMHYSVLSNSIINLSAISHTVVLLVSLLISIIAGRVTPMFTANGTNTAKVPQLIWLERSCIISLIGLVLVHLISVFSPLPKTLMSTLFLCAALLQAYRWLRWRPWLTVSVPLLWSLHLALAFLWLGLAALSFSYFLPDSFLPNYTHSHLWHLLTIGTIGGIILAMMARVSLGHSGRILSVNHFMALAFIAISLAAILRSLGPVILPQQSLLFVSLSSVLWLSAFIIFIINYWPVLTRPRIDGRPG